MNDIHKEIKIKLTPEEARLLAYQLAFDADHYAKQDQGDYAEFLHRVSRRITDQLRGGPKQTTSAQGQEAK